MEQKTKRWPVGKWKQMLLWFILSLAVWSASVAFMPLTNGLKEKTALPMILNGLVFWLSLFGTAGTAFFIDRQRRMELASQKARIRKHLGLISFFRNPEAALFDILLFASVIGFILAEWIFHSIPVSFLFLAAFLFSFGMHCLLNGTNYQYIHYRTKEKSKS